ncbi:DUF4864 domain-containing protein [Thetidibacter halocola]|uniref:DUF4864 domain-containing protein n=1 Tax=Thetidibacter halocola TaxID=2827239 RepID=A0A8J8B8E4_9RHOB|nr:DUF4864 domain-containing protein [Thetidibacter halocola]MBS0125417.1 DUF4864 domain-containing protein [Thetidibacter halocola]
MRMILLSLVAVLGLATAPRAQEDAASGIRHTIESQIEAFQRDDFDRAFTYASPSIQQMFRTPENFGAMVRNGYPMVWRPQDLSFGELRETGEYSLQTVIVQDGTGRFHALEYTMQRLGADWRIAGVRFIPAPEPSV